MLSSMKFLKRHPLIFGLSVAVLCFVACTALGFGISVLVTESIAAGVRETDPNDPLDGLPFITLGILFGGAGFGLFAGLIMGCVTYQRYSD